ncbi:hypothetical protein ACFYXF_10115 [Streptomyces sp. NPDC002680]|uniref:hypothetical protein n=1 Tax=Streptomyces sp. NPDC002680 TaxID=3364659 RepID=UPI003674D3B1
METEMRTAAIWQGVISDAEYFGRFARDLQDCTDDFLSSVIAFCMVPYFSLAMHESLQKLEDISPGISSEITSETLAVSARSRHSLKLFEDTQRGINGQISYFRDEIFTAHSEAFLGNTWLPLARPFETDLGLYSYGRRLISTTHAATFHLGFEPRKALAVDSDTYFRETFREYGAFFGSLGADLNDPGPDTFFKSLRYSELSDRDVRARRYYRRVFNGRETPEINATLTTFQALLNFGNLVLTSAIDRQRVDYTDFKIAYLCLYQVLRSLQILLNDGTYGLTDLSAATASSIVNMEAAQTIMKRGAKPFRNTLMHYNLPPSVAMSRVDLSQPFFGLVPIYFPQHDAASFIEMVHQCGTATSAMLDKWGGEH